MEEETKPEDVEEEQKGAKALRVQKQFPIILSHARTLHAKGEPHNPNCSPSSGLFANSV